MIIIINATNSIKLLNNFWWCLQSLLVENHCIFKTMMGILLIKYLTD